jgi:hypothetical protein
LVEVVCVVAGGVVGWLAGCGSTDTTLTGNVTTTIPDASAGSDACTSCGASGTGTGTGTGLGSGTGTSAGSGTGRGTGSGSGSTTGSGSGSGVTIAGDGGAPVSGTVGLTGGKVSRLYFTSTGDTRPAIPAIDLDPTSGYPTATIDAIYTDMAALNPQPSFVVTSGDYEYAASASAATAQLGLYMQARAKFPGPVFFAMGNHECSPLGLTTSNCGMGNADGVTANYTAYLSTMLAPIQQTLPYYVINIDALDGSWTSKFVFVAANAWDATQSAWLTTALAVPTTYTFVIRHEPTDANTAPGTTPSEAIIAQAPVTLEICGHTHDYSHTTNRVVLGNGGAPLTGTGNYGFGVFEQRSDGAIVVDEVDYQTGAKDASFHFVVTPAGAITQ